MLYPARWKKITVDKSKILKIDRSVIFGTPGIGTYLYNAFDMFERLIYRFVTARAIMM